MFVIGWIFKKQFLIRFNCWLFFIPCYKVCNPFQMTGSIYISFLSCPIDVITECLWSAKQFSHSSPIGWTIFTFFFYWLNNFHILLLLAEQFSHSFLLAEQFCGGLLVSYCLTGQLNCNTKLFSPRKVHVRCTKA